MTSRIFGMAGLLQGDLRDEFRKRVAWESTRPLSGLLVFIHPADARLDELGKVIYHSHYGRCDSEYGWEIDHRSPSALGGSNKLSNLRALHWRTNRTMGGLLGAFLDR
jgi:hypothetical protein